MACIYDVTGDTVEVLTIVNKSEIISNNTTALKVLICSFLLPPTHRNCSGRWRFVQELSADLPARHFVPIARSRLV